ncbi:MAG: hypothetical protein ACJATA_001469 [Sphingobacteriales bacterium]|jgi:hypothetical protein
MTFEIWSNPWQFPQALKYSAFAVEDNRNNPVTIVIKIDAYFLKLFF